MSDLIGEHANRRSDLTLTQTQSGALFILSASDFGAEADQIEIALVERGCTLERRVVLAATAPSLIWQRRGLSDLVPTEIRSVFEFLEENFPDQQSHPTSPHHHAAEERLIDLGLKSQDRLSKVLKARNTVQHDVAVLHLREALNNIEHTVGEIGLDRPDSFSNVDMIFAPTLWRMGLLDRQYRSFLLHGLPNLIRWANALKDRPSVAAVLSTRHAEDFLARLVHQCAYITSADHATAWNSILHGDGASKKSRLPTRAFVHGIFR